MENQFGELNISNSIQKNSKIGLWAVEVDEGCEPRMYADDAMLELLGLDESYTPQEIYHIWFDNIDNGYSAVVNDYISRMVSGEHVEVRYPWYSTLGEKRMIRCGGTRNFKYTKGIRLEGSHQDVTGVVQLVEESCNMVLEAVSDNYYMIVHVDFETGEQIIYKRSNRYEKFIREFDNLSYFERNLKYAQKYVIEEDRQAYLEMINTDSIISRLECGEDYLINYRARFENNVEWLRTRVFKHKLHKGKKCAIITVRNVTDEHEEELKQMAENAVISGLSVDYSFVAYLNLLDGSFTYFKIDANSNFRKLKGETYQEKIEDYAKKYVYIKDKQLFLESTTADFIVRNVAGGNTYFFSFRTVIKGSIHHDQIKFVPDIRDGKIVGVIAGYHNIDRQYNQLIESEEEHTTFSMLANSFASVFYVDLNRDYYKNYYNADTPEDIVDKVGSYVSLVNDYAAYVDPDDKDRVRELASPENIKKELSVTDNFKINCVDNYNGKRNYTLEFIKASSDGSCFVLCRNDVTELLKAEVAHQNALKEALKMAQTANHAKTVFLSNMSHDIRTPMNAIIGYTGLAQSHIDNREQVLGYLSKIKNSSDHLLSLINDILDMSRIESGKVILKVENENLKDIIKNLCDMTASEISKRRQKFELICDDIYNENIECDRLRLNQVVLNVLSNAIKYTPEGGNIQLTISGRKAYEPGYGVYSFIVRDNGIGMSKKFLETIFDPFTREKTTTVSGIQGTGLGMAITKNIIDMMAGSIFIESEVDIGTEVKVIFKFKNWISEADKENTAESGIVQTAVSDEMLTDDGIPKKNEASETEAIMEADGDIDGLFKGKKILLVEDNEFNMEIAEELLLDAGFIVDKAMDGTEAVDKMQESERYDAILMDVQMPVMDGYEATRRIRKMDNEYARNIPIIAMTANAFDEDKKNAIEAGMNQHLAKPIDTDRLLNVMKEFIIKH